MLLFTGSSRGSVTVFGTGSVAARALQPPFTGNSAALKDSKESCGSIQNSMHT